jgi:hypothetical protein
MKQKIRFVVLAILLLSILFLAQDKAAWANQPSIQPSVQEVLAPDKEPQSDIADYNVDLVGDPGTVKPPPKEILITKSGTYSVGGFCTIEIILTNPNVKAYVRVEGLVPFKFPDDYQRIRQGCHVVYYSNDKRINELTTDMGSATICFAAIPKKEMKLYFYDVYSNQPTWSPLTTTVEDGIACAVGNQTGTYVGTFKKH